MPERQMFDLKTRFNKQKNTAGDRGIEWLLSFEQWLSIWVESGHLCERGLGKNRFVMARRGDVGPYSVSNVFICTHSENSRDARQNHQRTTEYLRGKTIGRGNGWTVKGRSKRNPYQVSVSRKYVGCFCDVESAEAAYKLAVSEMIEFGCLKTLYRKSCRGNLEE